MLAAMDRSVLGRLSGVIPLLLCTAQELYERAATDENAKIEMNLAIAYTDTIEPEVVRQTIFSYLITRDEARLLHESRME